MERWNGKVALVTGASAGIGAAIAVSLADKGLKVVGVARRAEQVEALKKKVTGKGELHAVKCDVGVEEDITAAFAWVKNKFGAIHVLVNNAGIVRPGETIDQDPKFLREVMNVNVIGLTLCTQAAIKLMKEAGVDDGQIIHINSVVGHYVPTMPGGSTASIYPASKFAVTALTEILRQELRQQKSNIRITSLSPGFVTTEVVQAGYSAIGAKVDPRMAELVKDLPALEAQDIADGVLYVLSTPKRVQVHELTIRPVGEIF